MFFRNRSRNKSKEELEKLEKLISENEFFRKYLESIHILIKNLQDSQREMETRINKLENPMGNIVRRQLLSCMKDDVTTYYSYNFQVQYFYDGIEYDLYGYNNPSDQPKYYFLKGSTLILKIESGKFKIFHFDFTNKKCIESIEIESDDFIINFNNLEFKEI